MSALLLGSCPSSGQAFTRLITDGPVRGLRQGSANPVTRFRRTFQEVRLAVGPGCKSLLFIRLRSVRERFPRLLCHAVLALPCEMHAPGSAGCVKLKETQHESQAQIVLCRAVSCSGRVSA